MTIKSENNNNIGFSGFDNMISDISNDLKTTPHTPKPKATPKKPSTVKSENAKARPKKKTNKNSWSSKQTPENNSDSNPFGWVVALIVILIIIGVVNSNNDKANKSSTNSYVKPQPSTSLRPIETKPSRGTDHTLNREQIRYCLAQGIRIDAIKENINNYNDTEITKSNALVSDYNARCGQYRYYSGAQSGAERDINNHKATYKKEGYAILQSWRGVSPAKKKPMKVDQTVISIQKRLTSMGYKPGVADGIMGRKTREAIKSYQRDNNLDADGKPTWSLLMQLIEKSNSIKQ